MLENAILITKQHFLSSQNAKVLAILANGGTGKSIFVKKLELDLLEIMEREYSPNNTIPLLIKMYQMSAEDPSLENQLLKQETFSKKEDISNIKKSSQPKLIIFDGMDEYPGTFFNFWDTLKLEEWNNTKIIITCREETIREEEYQKYFNPSYYSTQQNKPYEHFIFKLLPFNEKDVINYAEKHFQRQKEILNDNVDQIKAEFDQIIQQKHIQKLLLLPINTYVFLRVLPSAQTIEQKLKIRNQTSLQELFFDYQFEREATLLEEKDTKLRDLYKTQYYVYFQQIAMKMFVERTFEVQKGDVKVEPFPELKKVLNGNKQQQLQKKLNEYLNKQIINRAGQQNENKIRFIHKSLFEYFVAKALFFDFQIHKNSLHRLTLDTLQKFAINQRYIMDNVGNNSELRVLQKFSQIISQEIFSENFSQKYSLEDITQTHQFIQIILLTNKGPQYANNLDIASSNMLSALAYNKVNLKGLKLQNCSFKKAYLYSYMGDIDISGSNLQEAMLNQCTLDFSNCNTVNACIYGFSNLWENTLDNVTSFVFSADEKYFFIGTKQGDIFKYEIQYNPNKVEINKQTTFCYEKRENAPFIGYIYLVNQKNILIVVQDKQIIALNEDTGLALNQFEGHAQPITSSAYFYDERQNTYVLATCSSKERSVKIWENLNEQKQPFFAIPNLDLLINIQVNNQYLGCQAYKEVHVFIRKEKKYELLTKIQSQSMYSSLQFTSRYIITATYDYAIRFYEHTTQFKQCVREIKGKDIFISTSICFSKETPQSKYMATGSNDAFCRIWNIERNYEQTNQTQCRDLIIKKQQKDLTLNHLGQTTIDTRVEFSQKTNFLGTLQLDVNCFRIWDLQKTYEKDPKIEGHQYNVRLVTFSGDGKHFATASDTLCKIWNIENGFQQENVISDNVVSISSFCFSPNGLYLGIGVLKDQKSLRVWNLFEDKEIIQESFQSTCNLYQIAFSQNSQFLVCAQSNNLVQIFNCENNFELIQKLEGHTNIVTTVSFSFCNQFLLSGSNDLSVRLWENKSNSFSAKQQLTDHTDFVNQVAFSQSQNYAATCSNDSTCNIYQFNKSSGSLNLVFKLKDHKDSVKCICFSPNGLYFISGSTDSYINIYDVERSFALLQSVKGHSEQINSLSFSVDSKLFASGGQDKKCQIWKMNSSNPFITL